MPRADEQHFRAIVFLKLLRNGKRRDYVASGSAAS
jgi:hypothetical protein